MRAVSRFESDVLHLLHGVMKRAPLEAVLPLALRPRYRPKCLSRDAVDLIADTLNKGIVCLLAESGGWRNEKRLRGEKVVTGRLWRVDKLKSLRLEFSLNSLDFLMTLAASDLAEEPWRWKPVPRIPLTLGDELLLFFAFDLFAATDVARALAKRMTFNRHGLIQLAHCDVLSKHFPEEPPRMEMWLGPGAFVLECLQGRLARRWIAMEQAKQRIKSADTMRERGAAQTAVLTSFFRCAIEHERRDLAHFLLHAALPVLGGEVSAQTWTRTLAVGGLRMADRQQTYQAALSFASAMCELGKWRDQAQGVAYWDENYQASQFWKSTWEANHGDKLLHTATRLLEEIRI